MSYCLNTNTLMIQFKIGGSFFNTFWIAKFRINSLILVTLNKKTQKVTKSLMMYRFDPGGVKHVDLMGLAVAFLVLH